MEYASTAHNRTVYASPPYGGSGFRSPRSVASLLPTAHYTHILSAMVFATQSPYPGGQNVVNSRNVMCHFGKFFVVDNILKKTYNRF
jgi:hypothetical protein